MSQETTPSANQSILLTTGIYDLIKDHIRRKKASPFEEETLLQQLKSAKQVTRKELPDSVVTVDAQVTVKDHAANQTETHVFVAPAAAKKKNNTQSILSPMGLALVGNKQGDIISWVFEDGERQLEIVDVRRLS
jgi:regulator of nucleoside diphosphate kinase